MNALVLSAPALPVAALDRLAELLASIKRNASSATWHAIEMDTQAFTAWRDLTGQDPTLPVAPHVVVEWLRFQAGESSVLNAAKRFAVATVRRRLATLATLHKAAGLANPCADMLCAWRCAVSSGAEARDSTRQQGSTVRTPQAS
jgi:hypothetical protein